MMATDIALFVVFISVISFGIWGVYMLVKISGMSKQERDDAQRELDRAKMPYKVDPPYTTTVVTGIPWGAPVKIEGGDVMFDPTQPPKRKYTKRKPAAKKKVAKKKTRKSK